MPGKYTVKAEGDKRYLIIDCRGCPYGSSVADYPQCMQEVLSHLSEVDADNIVLAEAYERVYDEKQTKMLKEIAALIDKFESEGAWSYGNLGNVPQCDKCFGARHDLVATVCNELLRVDPFKSYVTLLEAIKKEKARVATLPEKCKKCTLFYIKHLESLRQAFEETTLIKKMKEYILKMGQLPPGRDLYHTILEAQLKPSFIGSRLLFTLPQNIEIVDQYEVLGCPITIYKHPEKVEYLYYLNPPEYSLTPEKYFVLTKTKEVVAAFKPKQMEFVSAAGARRYFRRIYQGTIRDISQRNNIKLSPKEAKELAEIVARYTVGYGLVEVVLSDRKLTDVYIDSPLGSKPFNIVHSEYGSCQTNIILTEDEARSLVSRFRTISGRPFDEAHSVLDLDLRDLQTRVCVIGRPLSPDGTAFALRLHKETPWTLPLYIDVHMMDPWTAGLLSFFIDVQTTMLIAGSRGSGKSSMLGALMLEILQSLRIITQEDTLEIPVEYMRNIGFNIQRLKTQSAISVSKTSSEVPPEEALRTALRLGDSCLILGEVRSKEALVLYEAMRVGAVGNVVMGTIHAENAYSLWDRVVNDLGVPTTSFKATDLAVIAAPVRFKGSLKRHRRLIEITEVLKEWTDDPKKEGGLLDWVTFDANKDAWSFNKEEIEKKSHILERCGKFRGLSIPEVWAEVAARAESKKHLVELKREHGLKGFLEAENTVRCHNKFLLLAEGQREEHGKVDWKTLLEDWKQWVREAPLKETLARRESILEAKAKVKKKA